MKHRLATFCFAFLALALIVAPVSAYWQTRVIYKPTGGFTPACTESADWYARLASSGNILSTADKTKHDPFICGLVTDGILPKLNFMYSFLTSTLAQAYINIPNSSFTATSVGSPTFTANAGVVGGSGKAVNTNFTPSTDGGVLYANQGSVGVCILNNRTSDAAYVSIGTQFSGSTAGTFLNPKDGPATNYSAVNAAAGVTWVALSASAQGLWTIVRDSNSGGLAVKIYKGSLDLVATATGSTNTSGAPDQSIYILGQHVNGNTLANESSDTHALAFLAGALTPTDVSNLSARVTALLTAYSLSGC